MKTNRLEGKFFKKTVLAAAMIIGANTMIFQGFTQTAAAAEYNKTNTIPTSYVNYTGESSQTAQNSLPEGYKKANYTVRSIDLEYYKNKTPTEKDLTKEAAAELAAQYLWQLYGANLEGQTIEMGYDTPTDALPRPKWTANVELKGQKSNNGYRVNSYCVTIDSVTGELLNIGMDRALEAKVKAGPDASIKESEYEEAAKKLAQKYNIVHSDIESIYCTGQGASFPTNTIGTYGDPDISFEIHGKNGEAALMTISRYDKVLLGISYNAEYKYTLDWEKRIEQRVEQEAKDRAAQGQKSASLAIMAGN